MITETEMYWITRLDNIHTLFTVFTVISSIICGGGLFIRFMINLMADKSKGEGEPFMGSTRVLPWIMPPLVLIFSSCLVFIPTTKEYVAIKVVPLIVNNQDVQGIGKEIVDLAKNWLEELKPIKERDKR